jgi:hypothetical protein
MAFAQNTNSGDIRGTVTDTSGAVIPGVTVSLLNVDTGVSKDFTTNRNGLFDTSAILPGHYTLTFRKEGFETIVRGPVTVEVGMLGIDARLNVGSTQQTVTVTGDAPLLDTEAGDQTTTLESKDMLQLPQYGADWENFMILLPGASGGAMNAYSSNANPGQFASVNGNLPYTNVLADGSTTTLGTSQNSNVAIFETVGELQVSLSSFSAQYGIGGMAINQITKSGTDRFHGEAYEYFQNDALNAAEYGFGNNINVPYSRYNNFGGQIGGPILKRKIFFFFDYDRFVHHGSASNGYSTVPTGQATAGKSGVMDGDFTGMYLLYDPTTQTMATDAAGNQYPVRKSFQSEYGYNGFPSSIFDTVAAKVQAFYPTESNHISGGKFVPGTTESNGVIQNNFFSSVPALYPRQRYFGRLDYDITPAHRLTISALEDDSPYVSPSYLFACPIGCGVQDTQNYNAQVSEFWTISGTTTNEVRMGYTYQGDTFGDLTLGKNYPAQLGWNAAKANDIPSIQGTEYTNINQSTIALSNENVFDLSDVVTFIRGKHILHLGGEFLWFDENNTQWGSVNAGTYNFSGQYTQNWVVDPVSGVASPDTATGSGYADFLLGYAQGWNASVAPEFGARLKNPQMFIQDDYKLRPNLTLNVGLRYQINHGWSEITGADLSFDPTIVNPATNTLGAMWYGSTHANGRKSDEANVLSTVLPRVGFSWAPRANTTIRGGFGVYAYSWSMDNYASGVEWGVARGASGYQVDKSNGRTPITQLDGSGTLFGTSQNLPWVENSTAADAFNTQFVYYEQYHAPVPKIYEWNLAVQRQLGANYMAQVAYIGSHGFNLGFLTDLNQVPEAYLSSSDAQYQPYPQFGPIQGSTNNAVSNYNSLQATITRRLASGLSFSFNYVWSHFLDDQDTSGWGGGAGQQPYQRGNNPATNYSNANYDVRNAFKGYAGYELPFGKGKKFLNTSNLLVDELLGGWKLTGTITLSSGNPFSVFSNQNTYSLAGGGSPQAFPNWSGVSPKPRNRSINNWYNPAAFLRPADGTYGNVRRNCLYGPGFEVVNLSFGKTFSVPWEGVKFELKADSTNAFNHPSFGIPNQGLGGAKAPGQPYSNPTNITWTTIGGRGVQLVGRLTF